MADTKATEYQRLSVNINAESAAILRGAIADRNITATEAVRRAIGLLGYFEEARRVREAGSHPADTAAAPTPGCTCTIPGSGVDFGEADPACPHHGGPAAGHSFEFTTRLRGSYSITGEPDHHDCTDWSGIGTVTVRAWNLRDALNLASTLPLHAWSGYHQDTDGDDAS